MVEGLQERGWTVTVHSLPGLFPAGDDQAREALSETLASLPDGARVVVDGLAMGALPEQMRPHAGRLRLVSLVHHPLADETGLDAGVQGHFRELERAALALCRGVIVTSDATATRIVDGYGVDGSRVHSVPPGVDRAPPSPGSPAGSPTRLLCVASVTRRKGHDVLVDALTRVRGADWECICVGSLERDPAFAAEVQAAARSAGLGAKVTFEGECDDARLDDFYRSADLFVLPSHYEGYGMVLTEALARGIPVVSTTGGAIPGTVPEGAGLLVPPGDPAALATALDTLLGTDGDTEGSPTRQALARRAREVAGFLPHWDESTNAFARALMALTPDDEARLPSPAARFAADWLAVREPVDHRSRSQELTDSLRASWGERGWSRVLDLGSGTGSNLRYLGRALPGVQHWTLLDHDGGLLEKASPPGPHVHLRCVTGDLTREGLDEVAQADVVTASALLDLVSEEWIRQLVARCAHQRCGVLLALSYNGEVAWEAADAGGKNEADRLVHEAVNAHQHRNKGVGRALGPEAAPRAAELFRSAGFTVTVAPSPWVLGPGNELLLAHLVDGWVRAALEERPEEAETIRRWAERRRSPRGPWGLTVGHLDLLALPSGPV